MLLTLAFFTLDSASVRAGVHGERHAVGIERLMVGSGALEIGTNVDAVCMVFSREEVCAGATGRAVDDLMRLSEDERLRRQLTHGLYLTFDGWDEDPREVHQIPQCRAYLQALVREWPYFLHFMAPMPGQWELLVLSLIDPPTGSVTDKGRTYQAVDLQDVTRVVNAMVLPLNVLHGVMGLERHERHEVFDKTMVAIEAMVV